MLLKQQNSAFLLLTKTTTLNIWWMLLTILCFDSNTPTPTYRDGLCHGFFVTEHGLGQCLAQLGLAHAGGAQENEGAGGPLARSFKPHPAPGGWPGPRADTASS